MHLVESHPPADLSHVEVCLEKRHHTLDCPLTLNEQNNDYYSLDWSISLVCSHRKPFHTTNLFRNVTEKEKIFETQIAKHVPPIR